MSKALRDMGYKGKATPHGFRASFSSMAYESNKFPSEVIEKALAHEQRNRVRAVSVMMGSPAEMAGMKDGDMILSYDNRRMFNWNELQAATSLGERGEYVNVTVLRNGQQLNLWIPRGPLGIRLGSVRQKP